MVDLYDGFISYSHAADDLLAPRLQSGLQKFAKPWWKRRAVRIFRDESSLSANPHLWSSITEALDSSGWFVLLLSPDAAQSEWVNQEIVYWVENKDTSRILPVVSDGDFGWVNGDVVGTSVPPVLRGVFTEEPRWVDLRFAKSDENLDLQNPDFSAAVADIASAIRGVPKDELASEEVRQHRRTVRTAWAAGAVVAVLAVAAVGFGVQSSRNADEARRLAAAESVARAAAEAATIEAEDARANADVSAADALRQAERANEEQDRAIRTARRLVDFVFEDDLSEVDPPGDFLPVGLQPTELLLLDDPPDDHRLDFLQDHCAGGSCVRIAGFIDPVRGLRTGRDLFNAGASGWLAGVPFHIRHGFANEADLSTDQLLEAGYSVSVYITLESGPESGSFELGQTLRFFAQGVVREPTRFCGVEHRELSEAVICDRWVFDFPEGLPPGRYDLWVEWEAPCASWFEIDVCHSPTDPISLFNAGVTMSFYSETFRASITGAVSWPFDPWADAEPIPEWEGEGSTGVVGSTSP